MDEDTNAGRTALWLLQGLIAQLSREGNLDAAKLLEATERMAKRDNQEPHVTAEFQLAVTTIKSVISPPQS